MPRPRVSDVTLRARIRQDVRDSLQIEASADYDGNVSMLIRRILKDYVDDKRDRDGLAPLPPAIYGGEDAPIGT